MAAENRSQEAPSIVFTIKIADRIIEVHTHYKQVEKYFRKYRLPVGCSYDPDIKVKASLQDLVQAQEGLLVTATLNVRHSLSNASLETYAIHRLIANAMLPYDILLIHGSAIVTDGYGYLLTANSGVGKTTRTRLWIKNIPNSFVINGDKPFIHVNHNNVTIYGAPWCGKEGWNRNISSPLRAIFLLERAEEGEEDLVEELNARQAVLGLGPQTYEPAGQNSLLRVMQLLQLMVKNVKCYRLRCAPTAEAVQLAWETARPKE